MLDRKRLSEFAERGFVVIPQAIPQELVVAASGAIDRLIGAGPPGPEVRGPHHYFRASAQATELRALLTESPAFALAEGLYLLGHNIGGNTSAATRRAVYFRVKRFGHDPRWREFLQDPWLDYDAVRAVLT